MGWYNEHKFVSVLCTHWSWWWVWWWKWRGGGWRWNSKRLPHPLYPPPFLFQSSSYHPRIFSVSSSYHPHILSDVGCGGGVEMEAGGMWEMWVIAAFEGLARQHQDGMGWDGTDSPQKNVFLPQLRFKRHASARVVGWIQPKSRLRLFPGSAPTFFPFFASRLFILASRALEPTPVNLSLHWCCHRRQ